MHWQPFAIEAVLLCDLLRLSCRYALAFHQLTAYSDDGALSACESSIGKDFGHSVMGMFGMMLGDFSTGPFIQGSWLVSALFVTFMLVLPVVMMNVLIASMVRATLLKFAHLVA
ncbi:hypothetical protein N9K47_00460 [bacterium]|nr:hypothetical protein [bacterium]